MGEILDTKREARNSHDRHAVTVVRDSCVVVHLPQQYSRIAWYFLQHGGKISCEITGGSASDKGWAVTKYRNTLRRNFCSKKGVGG